MPCRATGEDSRNRIDLSALGEEVDFRWVMEHARQVGDVSVLDFGEESVRLFDTRGIGTWASSTPIAICMSPSPG